MYDKFNKKVILVTGGSGFLGRPLIEKLMQNGAEVTNFDLVQGDGMTCGFIKGNLCDRHDIDSALKTMQKNKSIDFVFHLAGQKNVPFSYNIPFETFQINVFGTLNLLESLRHSSAVSSIVLMSTAGVSGIETASLDRDAVAKKSDFSPYCASKISSEIIGRSYAASFSMPITICRLYNLYGPGQAKEAVISSILHQMQKGQTVNIGNVESVRDFVYIHDAVSAICLLALNQKAAGEIVSVGTGQGHSIQDVIDYSRRILGFVGEIKIDQSRVRSQERDVVVADTSKLKNLIDWEPRYTLEKGLTEMVERNRDHAL